MNLLDLLMLSVSTTDTAEAITITFDTLLKGAGILVSLGAAAAVIAKILKPYKDIKAELKEHEAQLKNDYKQIDRLSHLVCQQSRTLIALIDHELSGNDVNKLRQSRDELDKVVTSEATHTT